MAPGVAAVSASSSLAAVPAPSVLKRFPKILRKKSSDREGPDAVFSRGGHDPSCASSSPPVFLSHQMKLIFDQNLEFSVILFF